MSVGVALLAGDTIIVASDGVSTIHGEGPTGFPQSVRFPAGPKFELVDAGLIVCYAATVRDEALAILDNTKEWWKSKNPKPTQHRVGEFALGLHENASRIWYPPAMPDTVRQHVLTQQDERGVQFFIAGYNTEGPSKQYSTPFLYSISSPHFRPLPLRQWGDIGMVTTSTSLLTQFYSDQLNAEQALELVVFTVTQSMLDPSLERYVGGTFYAAQLTPNHAYEMAIESRGDYWDLYDPTKDFEKYRQLHERVKALTKRYAQKLFGESEQPEESPEETNS